MESNQQRIMLAVGAGLAVVLGIVVAFVFMRGHKSSEPPPASQSGLQVSVNETPPMNARTRLRCFKDGAPVGDLTLAECAKLNGVAANALDVGPDESGALAAVPTASMAPPPALPPMAITPQAAGPQATAAPDARPAAPQATTPAETHGPSAQCLRHTGTDWRQVSGGMSLNDCVQALFAGRCVRPGEAEYGRFGEATLRLVPNRVEISNDNQHFRTLVEQRRGCEIPQVR